MLKPNLKRMVIQSQLSTRDFSAQIESIHKKKISNTHYIKGSSERGKRILKNVDIRVGHKPTNTLRNKLCNLKDKKKSQDAHDAICKIRCTDCKHVKHR